ncbi:MAG TPA: HRDC domain-containing protein [Verrucomicrobiae bacterium]|nr:HRDC domain-containing protein [Verrucomicrobiae bacterium]
MVDTPDKLAELLPRLEAADWIAIDTEADSLHAYPEKLCLIQVSFEGADEIIDPLAGVELGPLWSVLGKHELIFHGADYDLRLLRKGYAFVPTAIFDTMIAARLVGAREFGLGNLVAKYLGITLEKGPQKANWARRPLTDRMETYARNDTRHLKPLADILRQQLVEKGRLEWQQESCASLIADCAQFRPVDPDLMWRVKGSHQLNPRGLAVVRELWHWREKEALKFNRPPHFVLSSETMVDIAEAAAESGPLREMLPRYLTPRRRAEVFKAIKKGLAQEELPGVLRSAPYRQTEQEKKRMHDLEKRRNHAAQDLGIDPTLIASRAMLVMLAKDWNTHQSELMNWQRELLSDQPALLAAG